MDASPTLSLDQLSPSPPLMPLDAAASQAGSSTPSASSTRRPPRKSTLTQQQKNQKRQRATQDQLVTLEHEFEKNPTPTAVVRERIAQEINMTERSVQIWFQNRRAKIKNLVKKSIENGEDSNEIPESMRRYLAMQAMETGKPLGRDFMLPRFGAGNLALGAFDSPSNKVGTCFAPSSLLF
jgi:Homeodomain